MKVAPIRINALLVTQNRAAWLKRCILSLRDSARDIPEIELNIVIGLNGQDEASARLLEELRLSCRPLELTYRTFAKTTPAAARNQLLPHVCGDWVLFIDDDAFVAPGFFKAFCARAMETPNAGAIGGPNLTHPDSPRFQRTLGQVLSLRFATFTSVARYRPEFPVRACDDSSLMLCNLFVRTELARELQFPPQLVCAEENWLLTQVQRRGKLLIYDPELWAWHERRQNLRQLLRQVFNYGQGRGQQLKLQPSALRLPHLLPSICLLYAAVLLVAIPMGLAPRQALLFPLAAYLALCSVFSMHVDRHRLMAAALFPAIHLSYGLGVLFGLSCQADQTLVMVNPFLDSSVKHDRALVQD